MSSCDNYKDVYIMLFYDEDDNICLKENEIDYRVLKDNDTFVLNGFSYIYKNNYFYHQLITPEKRIHPRKMGILEKNDLLKKPSFDNILDFVFVFHLPVLKDFTTDHYLVMFNITRTIVERFGKQDEYAIFYLKDFHLKKIDKKDFLSILSLVKKDIRFEINWEEDEDSDIAYITFFNQNTI